MQKEARLRLLLSAGGGALVAVALLAPWLHSPWLYTLAGYVCHQRPERCFWIAGLPMAFCARCLGIYAGATLALLLRVPASRRAFLTALALILLDIVTEASGLRGAWAPGRFLTGLFAGGSASPALLREMCLAFSGLQSEIRNPQSAIGVGGRA